MSELAPGSVIGILGGGQLGRMLSVAASRLGYRTHIYEPGAAPAGDVAHAVTNAPYEDAAALRAFAESVDVITYEFENVPTSALDLLESIRPIRPNRRALAVSQDRLTEKDFLTGIGLATAPYRDVETESDLPAALAALGTPAILKTRRLGYDGKGQIRFSDTGQRDWTGAPSVLEGFVTFSAEVSVIVARGADGQVAAYDPGLNVHREGILRTTTVPCGLPAGLLTDAVLIAARIVNALDYVGVMGVELFVTRNGLVVNEIAPRVHNSGHWTQAGCAVDQFEQHIRAVAGLPLGDGQRYADVEMENLIGDDILRLPELLRQPRTQVHIYGKGEARPGRKMGHVNRLP
ncbi:5-(carboxyamino)imidazole ribonucleotide synthase [Paracoccus aminovorans]|uniref:N5-carboxyaminoimidazole ribonucleotide synthase n=1 Tax=Paracoccus aminovorans TaxID=34004 RepID=A0A1I2X518_9RHOB|nr:5-(carboxyamino)imidazole ribonucleotide synthase [Paracoccus aminovorans]CQR85485.1 5-(carboxyamino)imidazole ribonucleotide synthase [Paracoccus aminovorans]SFH08097.1 5-(carboxyamino)imidazole ribonucleotide synthase [Paracoccus aminovorans]